MKMPETPDFDQIAGRLMELEDGPIAWTNEAEYQRRQKLSSLIVEQLRLVWHAAQADLRQRIMALPTLSRDEVAAYPLNISWVKTVDVIKEVDPL